MAVSDIYQFIWERGVEVADAPGCAYMPTSDLVAANPQLTEKRINERCRKSPYMVARLTEDGSSVLGWLIPVPPRGNSRPKHGRRKHAPLPAGGLAAAAGIIRGSQVRRAQVERVQALGCWSCAPTLGHTGC